jgi:hypothetical protein
MPNETYSVIIRTWTTTQSIRVVVVVSYTLTAGLESNITLRPDEVEIEVRNTNQTETGVDSLDMMKYNVFKHISTSSYLIWMSLGLF